MRDRVEVVREVYGHWGEGDFSAGVGLFDPLVVFVLRPEFADTGTYLGPEEVARYMKDLLEPWERLTIEADELTPAGDSVVAAVVQRGTGGASGAATEFRYFQVWTFRGDRVIRLESVRERADALAAVGVSQA